MRVVGAVKETIAAIVSFMASIIFINIQLIHQFVSHHADAVNQVLLRAGITLFTVGLDIIITVC